MFEYIDVKKAIELFHALEQGTISPDEALPEIIERLDRAHASLATLDPTGKSTADEMQARLGRAVTNAHIGLAIEAFKQLLDGITHPETALPEITRRLDKAHASLATLDPTGQGSADEMQHKLAMTLRDAHIDMARAAYDHLRSSKMPSEEVLRTITAITERLNKAREIDAALEGGKSALDESALDRTGTRSAQQVKHDLLMLKLGLRNLGTENDRGLTRN